jgi:hypothetical protein
MSALFGHRKLYDDEEAFEIAHILNEINSVSLPASSVLITRGMYWYKQGNRFVSFISNMYNLYLFSLTF